MPYLTSRIAGRCKHIAAASSIFMLLSPADAAQSGTELVARMNAFRASPAQCAGVAMKPLAPFSMDAALARVQLEKGTDLRQALKAAGYLAAQAEAVVVTGPENVSAVMSMIANRYCRILMQPAYSAVGVSRTATTWRIVFAKPLLTIELGNLTDAGKKILALVNAARQAERTCGNKRFLPAPPVVWNDKLAAAALGHSRDMATRNYFDHQATDGSQADQRVQRYGYRWRAVGENIAAGQATAEDAVGGWLTSPGHCSNIMNPAFKEMGAAYAVNEKSDKAIYWTQVFGTRF